MKNNRGKFEQQTFYASHRDFSYCIRRKLFVMKFSMKHARMDKEKEPRQFRMTFAKRRIKSTKVTGQKYCLLCKKKYIFYIYIYYIILYV